MAQESNILYNSKLSYRCRTINEKEQIDENRKEFFEIHQITNKPWSRGVPEYKQEKYRKDHPDITKNIVDIKQLYGLDHVEVFRNKQGKHIIISSPYSDVNDFHTKAEFEEHDKPLYPNGASSFYLIL